MSTIIREDGFRCMIFSDDHAPSHVHCYKAGTELVVNLEPISIRDRKGMSPANERRALTLIAEHHAELLAAWNRNHP